MTSEVSCNLSVVIACPAYTGLSAGDHMMLKVEILGPVLK